MVAILVHRPIRVIKALVQSNMPIGGPFLQTLAGCKVIFLKSIPHSSASSVKAHSFRYLRRSPLASRSHNERTRTIIDNLEIVLVEPAVLVVDFLSDRVVAVNNNAIFVPVGHREHVFSADVSDMEIEAVETFEQWHAAPD